MKSLEKLKDILYDSIDYIIMLSIVVIVVFVIGWRLDVLFAKDAHEFIDSETVIVDNSARPDSNGNIHNTKDDEDMENENPDENVKLEEPNKPDEPIPPVNAGGEVVDIRIPDGSLPGKIGTILEENGLVNSSREFVNKAVEMKMDTSLKSGSFQIPIGSDIEQVVRIIAKR